MRVIYRDGDRTAENGCQGSTLSGLALRKSEKDEPSHPPALIGQTASLAGSATDLQCAGSHRQHQVSGMPASGGAPGGADDRGLARLLSSPVPFQPQSAVSLTAISVETQHLDPTLPTLISVLQTMFVAVC